MQGLRLSAYVAFFMTPSRFRATRARSIEDEASQIQAIMISSTSANFFLRDKMHQVTLLDDILQLILGHFSSEDHDMTDLPHQRIERGETLYALERTNL
jgi:hypothetical protein